MKLSNQKLLVDLDQFDWLFFLEFNEVDIFQRFSSGGVLVEFHFSFDCAAFDVVDALNSVLIVYPKRVGHHHQMHRSVSNHLHSVNAVNSGQVGSRINLEVLEVILRKLCKEEFLLRSSHSLDNELLVMAEEEETSTGTACLACFEDIGSINSRGK